MLALSDRCYIYCLWHTDKDDIGKVRLYANSDSWFFFFLIDLFILFIYFWLRCVFVAARGLSLVAASGGLLFIAVRGLLTAVASLVAEHGL